MGCDAVDDGAEMPSEDTAQSALTLLHDALGRLRIADRLPDAGNVQLRVATRAELLYQRRRSLFARGVVRQRADRARSGRSHGAVRSVRTFSDEPAQLVESLSLQERAEKIHDSRHRPSFSARRARQPAAAPKLQG